MATKQRYKDDRVHVQTAKHERNVALKYLELKKREVKAHNQKNNRTRKSD